MAAASHQMSIGAANFASWPCGENLEDLTAGCELGEEEDAELLGAQQSLLQTQASLLSQLHVQWASERHRGKPVMAQLHSLLHIQGLPERHRGEPVAAQLSSQLHLQGAPERHRGEPVMPANYSFLQQGMELIPGGAAGARAAAAPPSGRPPQAWGRPQDASGRGAAQTEPAAPAAAEWGKEATTTEAPTPLAKPPQSRPPGAVDLLSWLQCAAASSFEPRLKQLWSTWNQEALHAKLGDFSLDLPIYGVGLFSAISVFTAVFSLCMPYRRSTEPTIKEPLKVERHVALELVAAKLTVPRRPGCSWGPLPRHALMAGDW